MDDAALVRRLRDGDAAAWADVYDRYADRLYDYCNSILHDRHEAEDALQDAFVTAAGRIGQLRDPDRLRPWLYAVCRTSALARARRRSRVVPTEEVAVTSPAPEGPDPVQRDDLRRLVWDAAGGLAPQDRAVLDLHLRHGLVGQELAEALEVTPHHATVRLGRVRQLVERSLTVLLVGRLGRRDCAELDDLLGGWDGRLDPRLRKRVARHIDGCDVCDARRRSVVSPLALLGATPLAVPPAHLRDRVVGAVGGRPGPGPTGTDGSGPGAATPPEEPDGTASSTGPGPDAPAGVPSVPGVPTTGASAGPPARRRALAVVAGTVALAVVAGLAGLLASRGPSDEVEATGATGSTTTVPSSTTRVVPSTTSTVATTTSDPPTTTTAAPPPPPPAPARLVVTSADVDLGDTRTEAAVSFRNDGGQALSWTAELVLPGSALDATRGSTAPGATTTLTLVVDRAALPEGPFGGTVTLGGTGVDDGAAVDAAGVAVTGLVRRAPVIGSVEVDRSFIGTIGFCTVAGVAAVVEDESDLAVVLRWRGGGQAAVVEAAMAHDGSTWSADVGPPVADEDITWWVEAADAHGAVARTDERVLDVQQVC
ncbi:MAG: sigma-70 family RNA polymerase sigma factor [Acidimicrobiia bacterium]